MENNEDQLRIAQATITELEKRLEVAIKYLEHIDYLYPNEETHRSEWAISGKLESSDAGVMARIALSKMRNE